MLRVSASSNSAKTCLCAASASRRSASATCRADSAALVLKPITDLEELLDFLDLLVVFDLQLLEDELSSLTFWMKISSMATSGDGSLFGSDPLSSPMLNTIGPWFDAGPGLAIGIGLAVNIA